MSAGCVAGNLRDDIWKCKQAADAAAPPTPFSGMPSGYASGGCASVMRHVFVSSMLHIPLDDGVGPRAV